MNHIDIIASRDFKTMQESLDVPRYEAVGILTCVWALTARSAPRGDIGSLSNEEIAEAIEWDDNPDELIDTLIANRWLEPDPEFRLVVVNWPVYCGKDVHSKLARSRRVFWNGQVPGTSGLTKEEKVEARAFYGIVVEGGKRIIGGDRGEVGG